MLAKIFNNHFLISRTTCANSRLPTDMFVFTLLNPARELNKKVFSSCCGSVEQKASVSSGHSFGSVSAAHLYQTVAWLLTACEFVFPRRQRGSVYFLNDAAGRAALCTHPLQWHRASEPVVVRRHFNLVHLWTHKVAVTGCASAGGGSGRKHRPPRLPAVSSAANCRAPAR